MCIRDSCTGVFGGIGYALIYSKNSSTVGSDFIIMAVKAIKPHLSLGKIAFWSDVGIILVGGILFRDIDGIIYGTVVNFIFAVAVDKLMYGINSGKLTLIVTEHGPKTVSYTHLDVYKRQILFIENGHVYFVLFIF